MSANQTQSRSRNGSITATKAPTGLQLLSPTFQQSIQNSTSKLSSSHPAEYFGWSTTPRASRASPDLGTDIDQDAKDNSDPVDFDFDGVHARVVVTTSIRTTTTTEDFEMSRRLQQHSFQKQSAMSRSGGSDVNRSTFQLSSTAAAAGFPMAKKKELTARLATIEKSR
ncbi:hypothetical protein PI124_g2685 [Phytophthora idaei]|nr:hypothetical protein PI125_g12596 [Phytophthora idaei]KAG3144403.1 hypothetical protein PI126_g14175 [Phytophthora idaei]KAG3252756.1 hypothetical protein PI124_g2685 [Phytophthora idaei]